MKKPRISGLERIRTLGSTKSRSIPISQRNVHIELYLLGKERERFEAEADRLEKRKFIVDERIKDIDIEFKKLSKVLVNEIDRISTITNTPKGKSGNWKSKSMKY